MRLLIDEQLSPRLAAWCAERRGVYAAPVAHVGLAGRSDPEVWCHAYEHARGPSSWSCAGPTIIS